MNDLAAPFRQLVERRLWPVAVLLVAALAAVPFLLAKRSSDAATPGPTASTASAQGETQPIVSVVDASGREQDRKVLGVAKNPFRPAIKAKRIATPSASSSGTSTSSGSPSTGSPSTGSTGSTGSGGGGSTPPAYTPPSTGGTPAPTYETYSLWVRFGETTSDPTLRNLERLKGLPGGSPKLVYLGLLSDHKTAVFLVDAAARIQGDGSCEPTPEDCQTLRMKAGDTVFVDVKQPDGSTKQYELDLVKVVTKKTSSSAVAAKARTSIAKGGRSALRHNIGRIGRYRYSSRSGTLRQIGRRAWKASAAKASARIAAAAAAPTG